MASLFDMSDLIIINYSERLNDKNLDKETIDLYRLEKK
jgi:hypothetical protein